MVEKSIKKNRSIQPPKYTLWERSKVGYTKNSVIKTDGSTLYKCFRVLYAYKTLPIGGFIDFTSCEIINNLIINEPKLPVVKKNKVKSTWDYDIKEIKQIRKELIKGKSKEIIRKEFHLTPAQLFNIESFIRRLDSSQNIITMDTTVPHNNSKYTLWDPEKVQFSVGLYKPFEKIDYLKKVFNIKYQNIRVPIGGFIDFISCEIIYDLISMEEPIRKVPNRKDKLPLHVFKYEYDTKNEHKLRYYYSKLVNDKRVIKSSINLFHLKQIVESEGLIWDWMDTPKELIDLERMKMKESLHSKLPFRVHKYHNKQYKQGFYYQYYYKNNDENIEMFSSVNLYKLKDLVESENLPWDWLNTPESLKKANLMSYDKFSDDGRGRVRDEYRKEENDEVNLPYRVIKHSTDDNRNGFQYKYKYYENKVSRTLSSFNLIKLEKKVKEHNLEWDWLNTSQELIEYNIEEYESLQNDNHFSIDHRKKLSIAHKGKHHTEETKKKISEKNTKRGKWNKGKHLSEEHKKKISKSMRGENNPNYNKKLSKETKSRMSKSMKGRSAWNKGKHLSEAHKKKIADADRKEYKNKGKHYQNPNLPYLVKKGKNKNYKQGFAYRYNYFDNEGKYHFLTSRDLFSLKEKVERKNLKWDWLDTPEDVIIENKKEYENKSKIYHGNKGHTHSIEVRNKMSESHRKFTISDAVNVRNDFNKGFTRTRLMNKYGLDEARLNNIFLFIENNPIKILEYEDEHKKGKYPRYIEKNTAGNYSVRLVQNQKRTYIGSYPSLEIAVGVRNILVQYNFFLPSEIIRYNDQYWVIMINDSGKFDYKGHYDNFEEAKSVANEVDMSCIVLQKNGTYLINKSVEDHNTYFGTYYTLEEAVKARDDFRLHGWSVDYFKEVYEENPIIKNKNIYFYRNRYNVVKTFSNGLQKHYGAFETFEEACKVRDELKKNNWERIEDPEKYIEKWGKEDYHIVRMNPTGNVRYDYGCFKTLDAARKSRDELLEEGFPRSKVANIIRDMNYIHTLHTEFGVRFSIEKRVDGKREYFGSFRKLRDAKIVRDLLELYDWNIVESDVFKYNGEYVALYLNSEGTFDVLGVYSDELSAVNVLNSRL